MQADNFVSLVKNFGFLTSELYVWGYEIIREI